MNKIIICILVLSILSNKSFSQNGKIFFGLESNLLFFRQHAPTVDVPFESPLNPAIGMSINCGIKYALNEKFKIRISHQIGFYRTTSNVTSDFQMNIYGFNLGPEFRIKKFDFYIGYEYNRLNDFIGKFKGRVTNWTDSRTVYQRNLSSVMLEVGYSLINNFKSYIGMSYFTTDFHRHGSLDFNGNIVGPVELTPLVIFLGFGYTFDFPKNKN